jgi:hypothetical protein
LKATIELIGVVVVVIIAPTIIAYSSQLMEVNRARSKQEEKPPIDKA